jgi:hypothetical protein
MLEVSASLNTISNVFYLSLAPPYLSISAEQSRVYLAVKYHRAGDQQFTWQWALKQTQEQQSTPYRHMTM